MQEIGDRIGYPPSEKQSALILKLADQLGIGLDEALGLAGVTEIPEPTGGGDGTASELIGKLIQMTHDLPSTEAQIELIEKLDEQMRSHLRSTVNSGVRDISELTKSDASEIFKMKGRGRAGLGKSALSSIRSRAQ